MEVRQFLPSQDAFNQIAISIIIIYYDIDLSFFAQWLTDCTLVYSGWIRD